MYQKTILDNGLTVVTERHPHQRSVAVGAFVSAGTRDENRQHMGVAHFVEHMVFKGTKTRTASQLSRSIDAVGGDLNAYTTREYTCFHAVSLKEDLFLDIDVLGDLVSQPLFSASDFETEKKVILQELSMTEDNHEEYIYDLFFEKLYGTAPLGWPILGSEKTLRALRRKDLKAFYRKVYQPAHLIVSAAGDIEHGGVVERVRKAFRLYKNSVLRANSHLGRRLKPRWNRFHKVIPRPGEQAHIVVGFPAVSFMDRRRFEVFVLNSWLGGGMSSQLYQKIREKKGLAYTVYSTLTTFTDCGVLSVYVGTDHDSVDRVLQAIRAEVARTRSRGISKAALKLFKQQVRGNILLGADDMESRMSSLGINEMTFGHYVPVDDVVNSIEQVSVSQVQEMADRILDLDHMSVLMMTERK